MYLANYPSQNSPTIFTDEPLFAYFLLAAQEKVSSRRATPGQYETRLELKAKKGKVSQYTKAQAFIHYANQMPRRRVTPANSIILSFEAIQPIHPMLILPKCIIVPR